jgi:YD repeat-containing protein
VVITPEKEETRYDADDRMIQRQVLDKKNGIDQRTAYGYNACGNRIAKEENGRRTIYAYNGKNQLVTEENA